MRRQLSISTAFDYALPIEEQLEMIAATGFTHVSLGENVNHSGYSVPERRQHLASLLAFHDLRLDTIHGPRLDQQEVTPLSTTIEAAAELEVPVVVAHGGPFDFTATELPDRLALLHRQCCAIAPLLDQYGVKLALENVVPGPATELVSMALSDLDPRLFGFCYDSAHDQIGGPRSSTLIDEHSSRLCAVHLSDRVRDFVDHVPPREGFIDWVPICAAIRASSFKGPLLFEVMTLHTVDKDPTHLLIRTYEQGCLLYDSSFADWLG